MHTPRSRAYSVKALLEMLRGWSVEKNLAVRLHALILRAPESLLSYRDRSKR